MEKKSLWKVALFYIFISLIFIIVGAFMLLIDCRWYGWLVYCILFAGIIALRRTKIWKGWRKTVAVLVIALLLFSNMVLTRPDLRISFTGILAREGIRFAMNLPVMRGDGMLSSGAEFASSASTWQPPEGYSNTEYNIGIPIELLVEGNGNHEKIILHLHGGAYVIGFMDMYRDVAVRYSKLSGGASVLSIDYRIAPANTFPAALEDAIKAWNWLIDNGYKPENIIVVGDSAGGNLALSLVGTLRDEGRELPVAMICMSPWADMASEGASHTYNRFNDPMFGVKSDKPAGTTDGSSLITSYRGDTDPYNIYLSPVYADYTGFPAMLLQVGTYEVLESDSITIFEKAQTSGVDVTLSKYHGMFHMFQLLGNILPEGRQAWNEVKNFLTLHFAQAIE